MTGGSVKYSKRRYMLKHKKEKQSPTSSEDILNLSTTISIGVREDHLDQDIRLYARHLYMIINHRNKMQAEQDHLLREQKRVAHKLAALHKQFVTTRDKLKELKREQKERQEGEGQQLE